MMLNSKDVYNKCVKVIDLCKDEHQLKSAERYVQLSVLKLSSGKNVSNKIIIFNLKKYLEVKKGYISKMKQYKS